MNHLRFLLFVCLFTSIGFSQPSEDWQKFVALETSRSEVEKVLGKPIKYFETFGMYETDFGEFTVWYSSGKCENKRDGRQYKVGPQLLTQLQVYLPKSFELKDFVWDAKFFTKHKPLVNDNRIYFTSLDESVGYVTGRRDDGTEFLFTATIDPGKNKAGFLCEASKKPGE